VVHVSRGHGELDGNVSGKRVAVELPRPLDARDGDVRHRHAESAHSGVGIGESGERGHEQHDGHGAEQRKQDPARACKVKLFPGLGGRRRVGMSDDPDPRDRPYASDDSERGEHEPSVHGGLPSRTNNESCRKRT
jgi:hypothetical protein